MYKNKQLILRCKILATPQEINQLVKIKLQ